jgi:transposase-like protein
MSRKKSYGKSRRETPWDGTPKNPTEQFLYDHYADHYKQKHPSLLEAHEADMVNSYVPKSCPYCGSGHFSQNGKDDIGIQRFVCVDCGKRFKPTTGTIFDSRRIPISEWMEYCLNIFRYVSINADSWNNKNAFTTSKYWLEKLFLTLEHYQDDITLSEDVWLDETYYAVIMREREKNDKGDLLRGLSRNQLCIGVATDKKKTICILEGNGKPSQKKTYEAFATHIVEGSRLIHDKESTHKKLIKALNLQSTEYNSKDLKGLDDKNNPLDPVNRVHYQLKKFLNAHSGFNRDELTGYMNLFSFVMNPPSDPLEKVAEIVKMAFENPKLLRYRDSFS